VDTTSQHPVAVCNSVNGCWLIAKRCSSSMWPYTAKVRGLAWPPSPVLSYKLLAGCEIKFSFTKQLPICIIIHLHIFCAVILNLVYFVLFCWCLVFSTVYIIYAFIWWKVFNTVWVRNLFIFTKYVISCYILSVLVQYLNNKDILHSKCLVFDCEKT